GGSPGPGGGPAEPPPAGAPPALAPPPDPWPGPPKPPGAPDGAGRPLDVPGACAAAGADAAARGGARPRAASSRCGWARAFDAPDCAGAARAGSRGPENACPMFPIRPRPPDSVSRTSTPSITAGTTRAAPDAPKACLIHARTRITRASY